MPADFQLLVKAVRKGETDLVRALLREEPALAAKPRLIVDAARTARSDVLRLLLERGADADAVYRGYRPLHALIQERPHGEGQDGVPQDRLRCLALLLEAGADPRSQAAFPPAGALLVAAFTGLAPFVDALLAAGVEPDGFAEAALGRAAAVERRLARDAAFATARDGGVLTALQCAAASRMGAADGRIRESLLRIAGALLDAGAEPNARVKAWSHEVDTAYFAASSHQLELFRLLLERGAEPTEALVSALWNATVPFAEAALAHGAGVDRAHSGGKPLLNDLIRWGQVEPALWLLEHGADANLADDGGWTAVHQAASRGNVRMLAAALAAGGERARRDHDGHTPLDVATERGRVRAIELLSR